MKTRMLILLAILLALVVPAGALAQISSYTSGFQLQNLDTTTTATISMVFYNQNGTIAATVPDTIAANTSKTYFPLNAVPSGFNGSLVIASNTQVAAITNVLGNGGAFAASYNGFTAGGTNINIPLIMKNNYGIYTWFNVQNTGTSNTTVNVSYKPGICTESKIVAPGAAQTFDQNTNSCLPSGFVGAATITTSGSVPVAVSVMQVATNSAGLMPSLLAYNGFSTASANPVMPLVISGFYNIGTGIQIQNTGGTSTNVTVTYTPSAGFVGASCTETKTIAAGASQTFGYVWMPSNCYTAGTGATGPYGGFVGSARVTANTAGHPLVAVVNQVTAGTSQASAYGAFNAASATNRVSLPLIMDRSYGMFTGFSVINVGTQPTNISCTFTPATAYTVTGNNVQPGAAITADQLNRIANNYVGSGVCTATGGDAKIVAVLNQLNTGSVIPTQDGLLTSEGINY